MSKRELKILLANPRGFCAGVTRAIDVVELALKKFGTPLYVKHEIVHNVNVVNDFIKKGVIFVESIDEVPFDANVILSAHGSAKHVFKDAQGRNLQLIDATCPLVTRVHTLAKQYESEGCEVIIVGHKNHIEVIGTQGQLNKLPQVVENEEQARSIAVSDPQKVAYVTQTTLSIDDTAVIIDILKERFPNIRGVKGGNECYATQNRQDAIKLMIGKIDLLLVVGSKNSSNSNRLNEIGTKNGIPSYLIDSYKDIDSAWLEGVNVIGISAGASAPEYLIEQVIEYLGNDNAVSVENIGDVVEDKVFFVPKILREPTLKADESNAAG